MISLKLETMSRNRFAFVILSIIVLSSESYSQLIDFPIIENVKNSVDVANNITFIYSSNLYILNSNEIEYYKAGLHLEELKHQRISQIYTDTKNARITSTYRPEKEEKYIKYLRLKNENYLRTEYDGESLVSQSEVSIEVKGWDLTRFNHTSDTTNFKWKMLYNEFDLVDGEYVDYYPYSNLSKIVKSEGTCIDGVKVGKWKYHNMYKRVVVLVHYNSEGIVEGKYFEYYYDKLKMPSMDEFPKEFDESFALITDGEYGLIDGEVKKVGTWNFYSENGEKTGTSKFDWIGK